MSILSISSFFFAGVVPRHRFMSAYEQKIEPPDRKWQYLLFAAEPYETISFKVPFKTEKETSGLEPLEKACID